MIQMPAMTQFVSGGGPVITGPVLPYIFITIACGAISGFHCMISTGTTPKMLMNERSILPVGYGAMLTESFVGMMASSLLVPSFRTTTSPSTRQQNTSRLWASRSSIFRS